MIRSVVAELSGGMGNQMFQYAYALAFGGELYVDPSRTAPRPYSLGAFGVRPATQVPTTTRERWIAIDTGGYLEADAGEGDDVVIRGLWMGEKPWASVAGRVRDLFSTPGPTIEAIAVHVRRTDFLMPNSPMVEVGADYYRRALERLPRHLPVLVFTDAPDWARKNVPGILVDEPDQHQAMALMSRCRHHVIANSSFSWWAAWLGEKGTVIAPSQWLKHSDAVTKQIVPSRWLTC